MDEQAIFLAAIEIDDPKGRAEYLDQACQGNQALRQQVEHLLEAHRQSGEFLDRPALEQLAGNPGDSADVKDRKPAAAQSEIDLSFLQPATTPSSLGRLLHYDVREIIGRGACGIVLKAFDEKLERIVAVKVMAQELATTSPARKRFLREARATAAIRHENVVSIHAVEEQPLPFLVMEYIGGETLQHRLNRTGPLDVPEILRIGQQIAAGLSAAHDKGLIHRDIKPGNILLEDGTSHLKITDFGLARAADDASLTSSGLIAGTPLYMAPEQARGEKLDHRADLFSLGSVMYQMASGRPPFRASNTVAVLKRVCEDTPRPIDDVIPGTPVWLSTLIFRLLQKQPQRRYQSAREVADLLAQCQSELQHNGIVTCVEEDPGLAETQVLTGETEATSGGPIETPISKRTPVAWMIVALIAVVALAGLYIATQNRKESGDAGSHSTTQTDGKSQPAIAKKADSKLQKTADTVGLKQDRSTKIGKSSKGWRGWAADAPKPAIAPFNAAQAKQYQNAWAKYVGVPVEYTNSIGMKFRLIPPGEFLSGSSQEEIAKLTKELSSLPFDAQNSPKGLKWEAFRKLVVVWFPEFLGSHEVTRGQFRQFIKETNYKTEAEKSGVGMSYLNNGKAFGEVNGLNWSGNPGFDTEPRDDHPVVNISWNDALAFCQWLSNKEGFTYRLPTKAEWQLACRAGSQDRYSFGNDANVAYQYAWFGNKGGRGTKPVGRKQPNAFGLYDMEGNVKEWAATSPGPWCTAFGGTFRGHVTKLRSNYGINQPRSTIGFDLGFRVVLEVTGANQRKSRLLGTVEDNIRGDAPVLAVAPFNAARAKAFQEAWANYFREPVEYTNSIGMKFRIIPKGEFLSGASMEEAKKLLKDWESLPFDPYDNPKCLQLETPPKRIVLQQPFRMGIHEVTRGQFRQFVEATKYQTDAEKSGKGSVYKAAGWGVQDGMNWSKNPGFDTEPTDEHPVVNISNNDADAFCKWLSEKEGVRYRLPSDAEWKFACRAGSQARYSFGDDPGLASQYAWFGEEGGRGTKPVGQKKPNAFGLYDMEGHVQEWCLGYANPNLWPEIRGGSFRDRVIKIRPSRPFSRVRTIRLFDLGFRVLLEIKDGRKIRTQAEDTNTQRVNPDDAKKESKPKALSKNRSSVELHPTVAPKPVIRP